MHTLCSEMNLMMSAVRIGLRTKPVLRDRLFGVVLGAALLHGGYLVYPMAFISSFLWCSSLVTNFVVGNSITLCPNSVCYSAVFTEACLIVILLLEPQIGTSHVAQNHLHQSQCQMFLRYYCYVFP